MKRPFDPNWALVALTVMSLGSVTIEHCAQDASRLSTVEAHEQDTGQRLDRMENKLDTLLYWVTGIKPSQENVPCPTCSTASTPR